MCTVKPCVYPAAPDSQPPPPPSPPSPMDYSYEFMVFQHGNHNTEEKLEYYPNFIMILLGELKTLREAICSCQQKSKSSKATRSASQSLAPPNHPTRPLKPRHIEDDSPTLPQTHEMNVSWRTTAPDSSYMPVNMAVASASSSLVEIPTERNKLSNESNDCKFYVERDALVDTPLDITFVHSFSHESSVFCVCFRCDGRYMAVGTRNSSIFIYEVESHKKCCELREYASQYGSYARSIPRRLCFSSDGRYLAVVDDAKRIIIWDVAEKRIRIIFHGSYDTSAVRFSPDGRLIACSTDKGFLVLNVRDKSRRMVSRGTCFDFSPNGRDIATGKNGVLIILDVRRGKVVKRRNDKECVSYLRAVKFTVDGRGLLWAYDNMVVQWDVSDAEPVLIKTFNVPLFFFYPTSISPDLRLVAYDNQLWDVDSGKRQYTLQGYNQTISSVDFSAAGIYLVFGDYDGFVSLWKYTRT